MKTHVEIFAISLMKTLYTGHVANRRNPATGSS
jgi:hypothetical protein